VNSKRSKRFVAEKGDLVMYFGSEWDVHEVDGEVAVLRKHNDPDGSSDLKAPVSLLEPFVKAADR